MALSAVIICYEKSPWGEEVGVHLGVGGGGGVSVGEKCISYIGE